MQFALLSDTLLIGHHGESVARDTQGEEGSIYEILHAKAAARIVFEASRVKPEKKRKKANQDGGDQFLA